MLNDGRESGECLIRHLQTILLVSYGLVRAPGVGIRTTEAIGDDPELQKVVGLGRYSKIAY